MDDLIREIHGRAFKIAAGAGGQLLRDLRAAVDGSETYDQFISRVAVLARRVP